MSDFTDDLKEALRGLDYPAPRNKLLMRAFENDAPPAVIDRIRALPETADFLNEEQLRQEFGVTVPGAHPHSWE
jgi:hypothetical protein